VIISEKYPSFQLRNHKEEHTDEEEEKNRKKESAKKNFLLKSRPLGPLKPHPAIKTLTIMMT